MNVVMYCRYSSEGQRDGYSIEAQTRAINEFCEQNKHNIIGTYIDEAKSGTSDNREQFQRMIADSGSKSFKAIIVHKLDRFARDRYDSAIYKKKLKDNGVSVLSVLEKLDDSPESVMMESIYEGMAEYYSKNLSREVKKGKYESARNGNYTGGNTPFGFSVDENKKFVIIPEQARIVKELFDKIIGGESIHQTAKWAITQGYRNKTGNYINVDMLKRMIRNPLYAGTLSLGKQRYRAEGQLRVDHVVDPIIDPKLFWALYNKTISRSTRPAKRIEKDEYILTGYLYCGLCGSHLKGFSRSRNLKSESEKKVYHFYRCAKNRTYARSIEPDFDSPKCSLSMIEKNDLEDRVIKHIQMTFFEDKNLAIIVNLIHKRVIQRIRDSQTDTKKFRKEINKLQDQQEKLLDLYMNNKISKDLYNQKNDETRNQLFFYEGEVAKSNMKLSSITIEKVKNAISNMNFNQSDVQSLEYRKRLLSTFVDRIVVTNDDIEIKYKLTFPQSGKDAVPYGAGDRS